MATQDYQTKAYWLRYTDKDGKPVLSSAKDPTQLKTLFDKAVDKGCTDILGYFGNAVDRREMYIHEGKK